MALPIAVFLFFALAGGITLFGYRRYVLVGQVYERLAPPQEPEGAQPSRPGFRVVSEAMRSIGNRLLPSNKRPRYQDELLAAGYRSAEAPSIYYGAKIMLAAVATATALLLQFHMRLNLAAQMAYIGIAALGGFRLPDFVLARRVRSRQTRLRQALPDVLDLMVVCSEAGLALDRILRVVGRELAVVHPEFSEEMNLVTLEVSAGKRRRDALENMAARTQEVSIRKFVTVLVQADRFGSEIADALRTHSEHLRMRRRIDAEGRAGKISVKLVFPVFLFILPCILLVTVGPAALQIWQTVLPAIKG